MRVAGRLQARVSPKRAEVSCLHPAHVCHGPGPFPWLRSCLPCPVPVAKPPGAQSCCWELWVLRSSQRALGAWQDLALSEVAAPSRRVHLPAGGWPLAWLGGHRSGQGQGLAAFPVPSASFSPSRWVSSHPWGRARRSRDAAPWQPSLCGKQSCHLTINTN